MAAGPNMEAFEVYFKRADLDQDGRISGAEAIPFFKGSNLPQHVLAQIWTYANQNQTGFLGRPEFYNALRLVTVAQSGRELTPDIVKAALGPAAAQIPAPKINLMPAASSQMNSVSAPPIQSNSTQRPSTHMGAMGPSAFHNHGVRGQQASPNMGINQQFFPSANNHLMRPLQGTPPAASVQMQAVARGSVGPRFPGSNTPSLATDWLGSRPSGAGAAPPSQPPNRGVTSVNQDGSGLAQLRTASGVASKPHAPLSSSSAQPKDMDQRLPSSQPSANDSRTLVSSGNGLSSDSVFGGGTFAATPQAKQNASTSFSAGSFPTSSNISATSQSPTKPSQPDPLRSTLALPHGGNQLQSQLPVKQNQLNTVHSTLALASSDVSAGPVTSGDVQPPWPKITQSDIQRYTKVFVEVDKDRDGKLTGLESRNLFLSWRLPREVLKQVWDLSDQDNDSMLSLREFCTALYLMERYREGRPLPAVLPNSLRYDEALVLATGQPSSYSGAAWQRNPGLTHQAVPGPRSAVPPSGMKPPRAPLPSLPEEPVQAQQKARVPELEKHMVNQLSEDEQKAINSKFQEATEADKKVQELEKEILDSREKTEFYRTKMQELVLYKSRCDNRLNEIMERVVAEKREVESLARKYEDKYKQSGDVASKLTLDEATFRDIQEKKLELYNAIVKMEQGGTADGVLQDRVDRIQSDLEELVRALNERCKQYGLRAKPATLLELPFGWQHGILEVAADWDEDWDKFNDEGFAIIKELTLEVENIVAKPKPPPGRSDKTSAANVSTVPLSSNGDNEADIGIHEISAVSRSSNEENKADGEKQEVSTVSTPSNDEIKTVPEKSSRTEDHSTADELAYAHSEDGSTRSPHDSIRRSTLESSSPDFHSKQFGTHDHSPHAKETKSDHDGEESTISGDKFFDEPSWGAKFDNDDTDSVWGFGTTNTQETDSSRAQHDSFFGMGDFGLNPIRTGSPSAESVFGADKKSPFFDSVPSTPMYNSSFSPRFGEGPEDHSFDRFSRFDSFNMSDGGLFPPHESFSRLDSMRSTADHPSLARFDSMRSTTDAPSFGSLARFDSMRSTADHPMTGGLARFDSIRSTTDYSGGGFPSFDDTDPFGSPGPFKSSESQTPRRSSDSWSAF